MNTARVNKLDASKISAQRFKRDNWDGNEQEKRLSHNKPSLVEHRVV